MTCVFAGDEVFMRAGDSTRAALETLCQSEAERHVCHTGTWAC